MWNIEAGQIGPNDLLKTRVFKLRSGRKITVKKRDQTGFWFVEWERGPTPQMLAGEFTDFDMVRSFIARWCSMNKESIAELSDRLTKSEAHAAAFPA